MRDEIRQRRTLVAFQAARRQLPADDEVHLAVRHLRELLRDGVVERVAHRQRAERLFGEARRLGDDEKQPAADFRDVAPGAAGGGRRDDLADREWRFDDRRPAGARDPDAVAAGDDTEGGFELPPVLVAHDLHRGEIARDA